MRVTAQSFQVLVGHSLDDVHDVIDGDHAHKALRLIHNRHRDKIIPLENPCDLLAIFENRDAAAIDQHDLFEPGAALGPQQSVEEDIAKQAMHGIDDENFEEEIRQIFFIRIAHEIDGLPGRPERRRGDKRRLHETPGRFLWEIERALEPSAIDGRQSVENLGLILLVQIFQQADGIVIFEILNPLRHHADG